MGQQLQTAIAAFGQQVVVNPNVTVNVPPAAAAPATPATLCPPRMTKPTAFAGKGSAAACFFLTECNNYILVSPMVSEEVQICSALQQLEGNACPWREAQFASMRAALVPAHLTTWNAFQAHFE